MKLLIMVEFQARVPHMHMHTVQWVKDAPQSEVDHNDIMCGFI